MSKIKAFPLITLTCSIATCATTLSTQAADPMVDNAFNSTYPTPLSSVSPKRTPRPAISPQVNGLNSDFEIPASRSGANPGPGPGNPAATTGTRTQ